MVEYNKKIIALDLQNASVENIDNWFLTTDFITANTTRNYIRHCITTWKDYEDPIQILYIINDFWFGEVRKNNFPNIEFFELLIEEILQLIPIKLDKIVDYRSVLIDWIFNSGSTRATTALALRAFQKYDEKLDMELIYPSFVSCVTCVEVRELGFKLKDFFLPLNDKFKAIVQEFKNYYGKGNYLKTVKLTRIYILDNYILGYVFQLEGVSNDHFFWNINLEDRLLLMDKFSFDDEIPLTLNAVLDKINLVGIQNLDTEEHFFLNNL